MRWGIAEAPRKHTLAAGDEARPWKTYGQLWGEHKYTRGALDKLVLAGQVPFVDGEDLLQFLMGLPVSGAAAFDAARRLGGDLEGELAAEAKRLGIVRLDRYYDMQKYLAFSAVDMLVPPPKNHGIGLEETDEDEKRSAAVIKDYQERRARELGKTSLTTALRVCDKCQAEIPAAYSTPWAQSSMNNPTNCPVCDATAHQLELLEQSRKGSRQPP